MLRGSDHHPSVAAGGRIGSGQTVAARRGRDPGAPGGPVTVTPVTDRAATDGRALGCAFADSLERRDWEALRALLAPDVVYEIPQTRERIRGRDRYITFNAEYPGDWHVEPLVVLGDGHNASLLFRWTLDDEESLAIAFFEVGAGRITKVTDFWPEPYEPPPGREHLVERW